MSYLNKNIEYLLKIYEIDTATLAVQTGIPTTLSQIKLGKSNPSAATLESLLDFFRIDMDTLLYKDISHLDYPKKMVWV
jgi:transcriptional regulator with XRE-family HTH domain